MHTLLLRYIETAHIYPANIFLNIFVMCQEKNFELRKRFTNFACLFQTLDNSIICIKFDGTWKNAGCAVDNFPKSVSF